MLIVCALLSTAILAVSVVVALSSDIRRKQAVHYLRTAAKARIDPRVSEDELARRYRWRTWAGVAISSFISIGLWSLVL